MTIVPKKNVNLGNFTSVTDPGCLSQIRIFSIPDPGSRVKKITDPGSGSPSKNLSILTRKLFLSSRENGRDVLPGSGDLDFLPIPDPGVKKAPDPGSGSATLNFTTSKYGAKYGTGINKQQFFQY